MKKPYRSKAPKRAQFVQIRLTPEERKKLEQVAQPGTLSAWLRRRIEEAVAR